MATQQQGKERVLAPKERIEQLDAIDKDATKLLELASSSIQALSSFPPQHGESPNQPPSPLGQQSDAHGPTSDTLEARKAAFQTASSQYFMTLQSINIRLSRQVYALEEAGLILPRASPGAKKAASVAASIVKDGGINPLDTGWLNGRKDSVGKDKEAELVAEMRRFVAEEVDKEKRDQSENVKDCMDLD